VKALLLRSTEGPQSAGIEEIDTPLPRAGEVRVALRAASLNHRELWISRGLYPGMSLPTVMGADGAGTIEAVGAGVDPALVGRDVVLYPGLDWGDSEEAPGTGFGLLGMPGPGTVAESVCVPAALAFAKPAHLSHAQAAALPVAALTAFRALSVKARVKAGERVLVTGIGGGVATFGLLFAKAMGARVFVTSGSQETLEMARAQGAEGAFDYKDEQWGKALRQASGGVDVVFDGAPAASFAAYGRALATAARVVLYGSTGGPAFTVSAPDLFLRHASILGTAMGSPADFGAMLDFVTEHRIEPVIDRTFPLEQARDALLYLEKGHRFGKVVIAGGEA
jgi:zinc-binding alcohol dehydrogenase/oxidoreductase